MIEFEFRPGNLVADEQAVVTAGFYRHSEQLAAPPFDKRRLSWLAREGQALVGVVTADLLWDWLYIDELWVDDSQRGRGLGKALMRQAEEYASSNQMTGVWLWTQSWQAADFYGRLGYEEFTRFEDFPRGHTRIGFRKYLSMARLA
jgi:ribosomal protein S18 acetylase RimI-like enzyme